AELHQHGWLGTRAGGGLRCAPGDPAGAPGLTFALVEALCEPQRLLARPDRALCLLLEQRPQDLPEVRAGLNPEQPDQVIAVHERRRRDNLLMPPEEGLEQWCCH